MTEQQRFFAKVEKTTSCWLWQAALDDDGYGVFRASNKTHRAHKWLWELVKGKVPEGLVLDHLCRVRNCVRPKHLEAVTQKVNCERADVGGRVWRKKITHCPQGHEYTPENTYLQERGRTISRCCRACRNIARAKFSLRQKATV